MTNSKEDLPTHFGLVLFPTFQPLDVFGPLGVLNTLALQHHVSLSIIAATLAPISTAPTVSNAVSPNFAQSVVPTHTFANPPAGLDVLIVPGGFGTRAPEPELAEMIRYVRDVYPTLRHIISVCTGSSILARAGVLDGRRATTNKRAWREMVGHGPRTHWVARARWVRDGNVWTSSGVSAGIDATLAWVAEVFGEEVAEGLAAAVEHNRVRDAGDDPFAPHFGAEDVLPATS